MASLNVHAPDGKTLTVQVPEGTDPAHYGALADDALSHYKTNGQMGGSPPLGFVAKQVMNMTPMAHPVRNLPLLGAMVGSTFGNPGAGAAAGAGLASIAQNAYGIATGDPNAPTTAKDAALSAMGQAAGAGIAQEPQVLKGIPGVSKVTDMASGMLSKMGKGAAKLGETLTGVKAKDLTQAAKQGLSTYTAPSLEKASVAFGKALGREGKEALKVPAGEAFDSSLGRARSLASDIGSKIENGDAVSSIEALKARQATDRIISSTPITDKLTRRSLYDWRSKFDDIISTQNGPLKEASNQYRQAIVKDKILNLTRLNKSGEPSAFLPMLVGHGMMGKGVEAGLGMLTGTSPLVAGGIATAGGSGAQAINSIAQNPAARQALMQVFQKLTQKKEASK